jgi:hypothetical protein
MVNSVQAALQTMIVDLSSLNIGAQNQGAGKVTHA